MPDDTALARSCELIRRFEGFRPDAYPDPATKDDPDPAKRGKPITIGYGSTGAGIVLGLRWTREQAEQDLAIRVRDLVTRVRTIVKVSLPDDAVAALVSFAYNLGAKALEGSTLLRKLNAGDAAGAAAQFDVWVKANGKVFPGLMIRRKAEREVFATALGLPKA